MLRRQLELSNEVAAELAGAEDAILKSLEKQLDCSIYLRGNVVTLDGEASAIQAAAIVVYTEGEKANSAGKQAPGRKRN